MTPWIFLVLAFCLWVTAQILLAMWQEEMDAIKQNRERRKIRAAAVWRMLK